MDEAVELKGELLPTLIAGGARVTHGKADVAVLSIFARCAHVGGAIIVSVSWAIHDTIMTRQYRAHSLRSYSTITCSDERILPRVITWFTYHRSITRSLTCFTLNTF